MIIREHCLPGSYGNREGWVPPHDWPDDCMVQWGGKGVVLAQEGSYRTAFFEAFPTDPATFIRGEGADVAAAELAAWAKFERQRDCPGHELERRGYRNGAGICAHCGLFVSRAFEPLPEQGEGGLLNRVFSGDPDALAELGAAIASASASADQPKAAPPAED